MLLACAMSASAIVHSYTSNSVLNSGKWVKIRVAESGVYSLTYEEIQAMGLNPAEIRIHGFGGAMLSQNFNQRRIDDLPAVGFWMEKGSDDEFGPGDYILFYGQGTFSWKYGTDGKFTHTRNPYSDYGYYFLSDNAGEQRIIPTMDPISAEGATTVTQYIAYQVHEEDRINLLDETGVDGGGREFYGEAMTKSSPTLNLNFSFPGIMVGNNIRYKIALAARSNEASTIRATVNGVQKNLTIRAVPITDHYLKAELGELSDEVAAVGGSQNVQLHFSNSVSSAAAYLNYIEITAPCALTMYGSQMPIRTTTNYGTATPIQYLLSGANSNTQIWDISDLSNIRRVSTTLNDGTLQFVGKNQSSIQQLMAVDVTGSGWLKPTLVGNVSNQNLHKLRNIDYVIISPAAFVGEATRLAQAHQDKEGITWAVVTDEQVYNEFSSGTPDASAYRWIMKMLYDRAGSSQTQRPKWLLLFGDGTYDNRKLLNTSGKNTLLTYQAYNSTKETAAYATDDYFGFMDNNEGEKDEYGTMEIGVGRLPVNTLVEAQQVTDKIVKYIANQSYGKWKNQLLFIADDGDNGLHTETAEGGAERVRLKNPDFVVNKVYLDAYPQEIDASGESYPLAATRINNLFKSGVLYMNYSGHAGYNAISNEGLMDINSIQKMTNENLGFWMLATCSFAHFDSGKRCAAEQAVLNPNGGAIAVLSACRTVFAAQNKAINRNVCDTLFGHKNVFHYDMTIGQATRIGKNQTGIGDSNKMPYILLGDPALRLNYPTDMHIETTEAPDSVKALTVHTIKAKVVDEDHNLADDFNGQVQVTVYDKLQRITTRDNDEKDPDKQKVLTYNDYPNVIFSGRTQVVDGEMEFTFMAPKDIRYNYGKGRIVYYAYDTVGIEAVGHYEDFIIGGSSSVISTDTEGPLLTIYLNDPAFRNGDQVYPTPRFFADIYDENGINTVGSGIGHDLLLTVDEDVKKTYILNEYFSSAENSYQSGQVSFLMNEMEEGQHSLTFRAWDLLNNSSTAALNFEVVKGLQPTIFSVVGYPNPVRAGGTMRLMVHYDQPDLLMETNIYVYDLAGHLLYTHTQPDAHELQLPLSELGIEPGVYMYRVQIKGENNKKFTSRSGKMIVTK